MNVIVQDVVRDNYLIPFKITREQINETVTHETAKKIINFSGYTVILFLRKFENHYILVDGRWNSSTSSLNISNAFRFHEELIKNIPIDNPLAVLQHFANQFGVEIRIGDQKGKFIDYVRLETPLEYVRSTGDVANIILRSISHSDNELSSTGEYLTEMVHRAQVLGGKLYVELSMLYRINTKKYTEYLKSNNLI
ncbi:MAG: hypothetical protein M3136_08690 [Thermoproteota archaeon]|jgi:hypothetical protein|nr:hypothetical protein [Thermoproteota archaeon]